MFDSPTLSVSELASRWGKTPRQILDHAKALHIPFYFMFEGLAFDDQADRELKFTDTQQTRDLEDLQKGIADGEWRIKIFLSGQADEFSHPDDRAGVNKMRATIEAYRDKCELLEMQIEQHQRDRQKMSYLGLMRAAPATLKEVEQRGEATHVLMAYHPDYSVKPVMTPGEPKPRWEGRLMWLEPVFDALPVTTENLLALTKDVRALEAHWQAATAISEQPQAPAAPAADAQPQAAPAKAGTAQRWTPEFTSDVKAYRDSHTEQQTAAKFGVSGQLIRRKLAETNSASKPDTSPFSGLGTRSR